MPGGLCDCCEPSCDFCYPDGPSGKCALVEAFKRMAESDNPFVRAIGGMKTEQLDPNSLTNTEPASKLIQ